MYMCISVKATCHVPIRILDNGGVEKLKHLEVLKKPYLHNCSTDFYGTKTKTYCKASSIIICNKESGENNLQYMPTTYLTYLAERLASYMYSHQ